MTPTEIEIEIQTYIISKLSETTYSGLLGYTFEGVDLDDEPDPISDSWMLFRIALISAEKIEIRRGGIGIRDGNLHVVINTPKSISNGKRLGLDYADEIENDFMDYSTDNVNFMKPNTIYVNNVDWHTHMVTIPFYTTIGE